MSAILEKAAELAAALEESEELKTVHECEMAVRMNPVADAILTDFFETQNTLQQMQMRGEQIDDELISKLNQIQDHMENNELIAKYYKSQEALGIILQQINGMLSKALTGEEACDPNSCATCGGC